jgi:hypothetical protein
VINRAACVFVTAGVFAAMIGTTAYAQEDVAAIGSGPPERPTISFNRWQEDWSVLADPQLRTEPFDNLKYIPLWSDDPQSYAWLGADLRERFESVDAPSFGVGGSHAENYLLQRALFHVDIRPDDNW